MRRPHVLILRDPRESASKCSLTPLRGMPGIEFRRFDAKVTVPVEGRVLLHPDGEEISAADRGRDLLLLDSNWRRLPRLVATLTGQPILRRLPPLLTAYPRKSRIVPDPERGLASVEALWAALALLGDPRPELLADYHFREAFFDLNPSLRALLKIQTEAGGPQA